jgi:hypothetical protein
MIALDSHTYGGYPDPVNYVFSDGEGNRCSISVSKDQNPHDVMSMVKAALEQLQKVNNKPER